MFTREYLKSLATAISFSRGESYFEEGNVGKIIREGSLFTAKVYGSDTYKVKLTLQAGGARFKCNCPYDFEGICKHKVALGLAVLEKFGPRLQPAAGALDTSLEALGKALRDTSADVQLEFLAGLLRQNEDLRREFLHHVAPAPPPAAAPQPVTEATIESISTEVYEALADLAFDDEVLSEYADHYEDYLYDEGGGMLELADEAIAEVLEPYAEAVAAEVRAGQLTAALHRWVGVYEGISAATDPQADDYDLFGYEGYSEHVLDYWANMLAGKGVDATLETRSFAPAETEAMLALLLGRYQRPATSDAPAGLLIPAHFHDLLLQLAHDPVTATQLRLLLAPPEALDLGLAQVLLRVAQVLADDALWLQTAEHFAGQEMTLTTQLLDYYRQHDDRTNLLRVLRQWQPKYGPQLNPYVLSHVLPSEDEALYLHALEQRCRNTRSLADFRELSTYWSSVRRQQFVDEQLAQAGAFGGSPLFAAELLDAENRSAEVLALLRQQWTWQSHIPDLLTLAARTHPVDCLDAVMERTETLLQDSINGRGRDVYQRLISWLMALHAFNELRPQVVLFATHLYAEYSRLSALREELRAAKLVHVLKSGNQYQLVPPTAEDDELRELLLARQTSAKAKKK